MGQSHCAQFSKELYPTFRELICETTPLSHPIPVYDPMAGVGSRLEEILEPFPGLIPVGSEIEEEYAAERPWIIHEDCRKHNGKYLLIISSQAYANRFADQYLGTPEEQELRRTTGKKPRRNSYAIDLGRRVTPGSCAEFQWGPKYRELMEDIWRHVVQRNLLPGGHLIANVASHFRAKEYAPVHEWTLEMLLGLDLGLVLTQARFVPTPGNRDGQNRESRVGGEMVYLFWKL